MINAVSEPKNLIMWNVCKIVHCIKIGVVYWCVAIRRIGNESAHVVATRVAANYALNQRSRAMSGAVRIRALYQNEFSARFF